MPQRQRRDPRSPDFPHGTPTGYNAGCRPKHYTCPASPTCSQVNQAHVGNHRKRPGAATDAKTTYVQRRLRETIETAGLEQVIAHTGLTAEQVQAALERTEIRMPNDEAFVFDKAWAWLMKGSDVTAPGVPHGKSWGYTKSYCRCVECREAQRATSARNVAGVRNDHTIIDAPRVQAHIETLVDQFGVNVVAAAAGVTRPCINAALVGRVRVRTARTLLALTAEQCHPNRVSADRAYHYTRTMQALGYTLAWQARQAGLNAHTIETLRKHRWITVRVADAIAALAERVGDTPAAVDDDLNEQKIAASRNAARKAGYYPPIHYDENGNLDWRSIPDHPWSKADARCARALDLAYVVAKGDRTAAQLVYQGVTSDTETVERMRKRLGIVAGFDYDTGLPFIQPESAERAAWVRSVIEDYYAGLRGPVDVALTVGARDVVTLPKTHPEVAVWRERCLAAAWETWRRQGDLVLLEPVDAGLVAA